MKNITVVGVGYVGMVSGTCFADLGNRVRRPSGTRVRPAASCEVSG